VNTLSEAKKKAQKKGNDILWVRFMPTKKCDRNPIAENFLHQEY
jgi:hypothetical protein